MGPADAFTVWPRVTGQGATSRWQVARTCTSGGWAVCRTTQQSDAEQHERRGQLSMVSVTDGTGPGAFDVAQAHAYAAAVHIETEFPHDQVFLELLRHHARGAALDLGGGTGRYAAWLLTMQLATSAHVIDNSPAMLDACARRGVPGLTTQPGDIETTDLGRERYDIVLARFVLMHIRALEAMFHHIAMSLTETGTLVAVTNVIEGTPPAVATYMDETAGIMQLMLQAQGHPIAVSNYVHTQDDYTHAFQRAGLRLAFCELYAPQIVRRMVKKLETGLTIELKTLPSPTLWLAYCPQHHAYSTPMEGGPSGGYKTYGLEDIARVHHGNGRSGTAGA